MFTLVDRPVIFPAHTLLGNQAGPVVDTGCEIQAGGRVYIDRTEAGEIARHFGFETPEQGARRDQRIEQLEAEVADYQARLATLHSLIEEHATV